MRQHKIDHPNAKMCWETTALRGGKERTALLVETDLIHDQNRDGFDADLFQGLKNAAEEYVSRQTHIDVVVFFNIGDRAAQKV